MFRPLAIFIGLRYTRAKRRNHFVSFISLMSMLGIALGIVVLITVLSVMNGFDRDVRDHIVSMVPPITVMSMTNAIDNPLAIRTILEKNPSVKAVSASIREEAMLTHDDAVSPATLTGIVPANEKKILQLQDKMIEGRLSQLVPNQFNIVLGEELANRLGVGVGDKVTALISRTSFSLAGVTPRLKRFTVTGIFHAGDAFGFDRGLAFVDLSDAARLFEMGSSVTTLSVKIDHPYEASLIAAQLAKTLDPHYRVMTWMDTFGYYFHMIAQQKVMMFFILMLIILVAVFNLVSTLVMVVNEKESDIAILKTLGATPRQVMSIFVVQGAVIGVLGIALGVAGGIALSLHVTEAVRAMEHVLHMQLVSPDVYVLDYLPSELHWSDIWHVGLSALILSLLATLYPAKRASHVEPVEALRYE